MDSNQGHLTHSAVVLLIIGEPYSEEEKTLILDEVTKGFRCWDVEDTGVNINEELAQIASRASLGVEGSNGERLIQHQSDNLGVEILINPLTQTVKNSIKKLLIAPAPTKYIIYAGHVFQGSGAWVLQDDTFAVSSLAQVFKNIDVENALKQNIEANLTIHTLADSNWGSSISKADFTNSLRIQLNPPEKLENVHGVQQFVAYVGGFARVVPITSLLQASEQFGNISFSRPTLYIFPGCQGDSALFGVSGFNLLVNGGYNRRACFWDFARHLDRVDAMLMTHLGTDNIFGLKAVLQRKSLENIHPQIGYLFFNALDKQSVLPSEEDGDGDSSKKSSLLINLTEEANKVTQMAKQLGISPHPCSRSAVAANCEPVNLYHKLGHGSLDMYILNPITDSKELKEFHQLWNKQVSNFGTSGPFSFQNALSVCTLLVWKPYNLEEKIVRILFPGNAPQHKVIEGFEKMKSFGFLKHASCTTSDLMKPQSVKKPAVGSLKLSTGSKGSVKTSSSRSDLGKSLNATRLESPRKETKTIPAKLEAKMISPTKTSKSVKDESSIKSSKVSEKPRADEKEAKLKSAGHGDEKEPKIKKSTRTVSAVSPVRGASITNKLSSPTKSTSLTKSSTQEPSSPIKSPAKTKASFAKSNESKSVVTAIHSPQTDSNACAVIHVDKHDVKSESEQNQLEPQGQAETHQPTDDTISKACDAVGAIDDMSVSVSSAVDKHKLEDLGFYEEKHGADYAERAGKYELEDEETPQALPEPTIMIESPSLESEGLPGYIPIIQLDQQKLSEFSPTEEENEHDNKNQTYEDPAQEIVQSRESSHDGQSDNQLTSSAEQPSEFETPIFTNDGPDPTGIPNQSPVEQSIQYGIDNSSNGRDMGGIQEVDEEENEDYGNITGGTDVQNENTLDKEALREMGIYDDEDDDGNEGSSNGFEKDSNADDNEVKKDQEEEEELGNDGRTSAERQFEDVDDETSQQPEDDVDERIEDDSSLPAAFDKDSSPEDYAGSESVKQEPQVEHDFKVNKDTDAIDDGRSYDEINGGEVAFSKVNGDVNQSAEQDQIFCFKSAGDASLNPFFNVGGSALGGHTQSNDFGGESEEESATSFDPVTQWDHPMGLPSPLPSDKRPLAEGKKRVTSPTSTVAVKTSKSGSAANDSKPDGKKQPLTAPGKGVTRQGSATKRVATSSSRSSPLNNKIPTLPPMTPFYVDLTYVPNHGDSSYSDVEFFKRIRARYYVISALSPNPQVLDSLLEAKATWEQKDLEVTIIPTYENETLRHWMGLNAEKLQELRVDLKPAVSRCTIQLQDLETSLPAYRLEV